MLLIFYSVECLTNIMSILTISIYVIHGDVCYQLPFSSSDDCEKNLFFILPVS